MKMLLFAVAVLLPTRALTGRSHDVLKSIQSLNKNITRDNFDLLAKIIAEINFTDDKGRTPLHLAVQAGDLPAVNSLLQLGADPQLTDALQLTPFAYAEQQTPPSRPSVVHMSIASLLLEAMNGINGLDQGGWSPLLWAIAAGDIQRVKELLDAGALFILWGNNGIASLARQLQDKEILKIIEAHLDAQTTAPSAMLLLAIETDNQLQVEQSITELTEDKMIDSMFLYSLTHGHHEATSILSEHLSDVNVMLDFHGTPLQHAINAGQLELAHSLLVERGANPNLVARNGHSPLMDAIRNRHFNFAHTLLDYGADASHINQGYSSSISAFTEAIMSGNLELTKRIIELVGNVNQPIRGRLPMLIATNQGNTEILRLLITYGGDVNLRSNERGQLPTCLHSVAALGNIEKAKLLLDYGADLNATTIYGETSLMTAALLHLPDMVRFLLEQGADHRFVNSQGRTALDIARVPFSWGFRGEIVEIINLLEKADRICAL